MANLPTDGRLTDEEWLFRYNQRFRDRAAWEGDYSEQTDNDVKDLRELFYDNDPEDSADEEMSYWDNDE